MGKYNKFERRVEIPRNLPYRIHPIWRGIGCLMLVIIPIMAYAGAVLLLEANTANGWLYIPPELNVPPVIPYINYMLPVTGATLVAAILLALAGFGVLMMIYALMYSVVGPPKNPLDAPPERWEGRKRR
jgi:hypothetical protein